MKAHGTLANVQGCEETQQHLVHIINVMEVVLGHTLLGPLSIQAFQDHACSGICSYHQPGGQLPL